MTAAQRPEPSPAPVETTNPVAAPETTDVVAGAEALTRITQPTLDVLAVLLDAEHRELHGWAIIKHTRLRGPTVYKILDRLAGSGFVTARWEREHPDGNKPRRRFYQLTSAGSAHIRALLTEHRAARARRQGRRPRPLAGSTVAAGSGGAR